MPELRRFSSLRSFFRSYPEFTFVIFLPSALSASRLSIGLRTSTCLCICAFGTVHQHAWNCKEIYGSWRGKISRDNFPAHKLQILIDNSLAVRCLHSASASQPSQPTIWPSGLGCPNLPPAQHAIYWTNLVKSNGLYFIDPSRVSLVHSIEL